MSRETSHKVLLTVFIFTVAWWPLLNVIKGAHNPYFLGLLKVIFYLDNFGMLLSWYSFRALALGAEPDIKDLVKLALWTLIILILIDLPVIIWSILS